MKAEFVIAFIYSSIQFNIDSRCIDPSLTTGSYCYTNGVGVFDLIRLFCGTRGWMELSDWRESGWIWKEGEYRRDGRHWWHHRLHSRCTADVERWQAKCNKAVLVLIVVSIILFSFVFFFSLIWFIWPLPFLLRSPFIWSAHTDAFSARTESALHPSTN